MKLELAENLEIDFKQKPWKTQGLRIFVCAMSGGGKSYTLMKTLEQAYHAGLQFIFLDPHGEGHTLAAKDFATEERIVVVSERYGVPIDPVAIPVYVDLAKAGTSLVLDLSKYFAKSKSKFNEFAEQFIREFFAQWSDIRRPIFLVMDEAHYFAPQQKTKGSMDRVALIEELSTAGRKFGIHLGLSTQRPALIDKTPISQANLRLIGKLEGKNDWAAVKEYVKDTVSFSDLRALESGTFITSVEGESRMVHIAERETRDAGATPEMETNFSKAVEVEIGEVADKIRNAIEAAREEAEKEKDLQEQLKQMRRENEDLREKLGTVMDRFETLSFISEKMGDSTDSAQDQATDSRELNSIKQKLSTLQTQYESEIESKAQTITTLEQEISNLQRTLEPYEALSDALNIIVSPGNAVDYSSLVDEVSTQVLSRIDVDRPSVQVSPLEALERDWEQNALNAMEEAIDQLPEDAIRLTTYLLKVNKYVPKKNPMKAVFHIRTFGGSYARINSLLEPLKEIDLVAENQRSEVKATPDEFIKRHLGETPDEDTGERLLAHVIQYLRSKPNGGLN